MFLLVEPDAKGLGEVMIPPKEFFINQKQDLKKQFRADLDSIIDKQSKTLSRTSFDRFMKQKLGDL